MAELPSVHWSEIVKAKRAAREALIPPEWRIPPTTAQSVLDVPRTCGILTDAELAITEMEAPELVETMSKGELKSYDVMLAFCKRAAVAHQLVRSDLPKDWIDMRTDKLPHRDPVHRSSRHSLCAGR